MNWQPSVVPRAVVDRILRPLERYLRVEAAGGVALLAATIAALFMANSRFAAAFESLWSAPLTLGVGPFVVTHSARFWINDGLMTVFFLVVGLEVKREWQEGVLSDRRTAVLPFVAALGGVIVPAAIYLTLNPGPGLRDGWAIPTATDIAFAVGVLLLLGKRVPPALRALLLTLAIVDDVMAVMVIAWYYSAGIHYMGLLVAGCAVFLSLLLQRVGAPSALTHVAPGVLVWAGLEHAGIHPTLAGVVLALLTPSGVRSGTGGAARDHSLLTARRELREIRSRLRRGLTGGRDLSAPLKRLRTAEREGLPPASRIEAALHPWVAYGVMPVFALANAGVVLASAADLAVARAATVSTGIVLALVLGKPLGIFLGARLSVASGLCALPEGIGWRHVLVLGCLGGIGFTMSVFIGNLAFTAPALVAAAKLSVLAASVTAAAVGLTLGWAVLKPEGKGARAGEH